MQACFNTSACSGYNEEEEKLLYLSLRGNSIIITLTVQSIHERAMLENIAEALSDESSCK